jgi:hypothetical protein
VFRATLRPYLALLLLLCLGRTLLPEAWVITWHAHAHTTDEPAFAAKSREAGRLLFTTQHQHCHAEQFYNVPFALGSIMVLPQPRVRQLYSAWRVARWLGCPQLAALRAQLRGPPVAA